MRVDQMLLDRGLVKSRTQSQRLIKDGKVQVRVAQAWESVKKPSAEYDHDCEFRIDENDEQRFVSRAGLKLNAALDHLGLSVEGQQALDVGQSTGGFSDCLIQAGVGMVVGIDVGHGQLAPSLKEKNNVICIEGINARELEPSLLMQACAIEKFDLIVMDVSFISQTKILPRLSGLLAPEGKLLSLVKPQFEVGPQGLGKGGIVKNESWYPHVQTQLISTAGALGFQVIDYFESAIQGGDGNREFFMYAQHS